MIFKPINDRKQQTAPEPVVKLEEPVVAAKTTAKQVRTKTPVDKKANTTGKQKKKTTRGKI